MILKAKLFYPPYNGWSLDSDPYALKAVVGCASSSIKDDNVEFFVRSLNQWRQFLVVRTGETVREDDGSAIQDCDLVLQNEA